jgi:hypothetical protein
MGFVLLIILPIIIADMDRHLHLSACPHRQKPPQFGRFPADFTESYRGQYV